MAAARLNAIADAFDTASRHEPREVLDPLYLPLRGNLPEFFDVYVPHRDVKVEALGDRVEQNKPDSQRLKPRRVLRDSDRGRASLTGF